jgi:hypothetical protein
MSHDPQSPTDAADFDDIDPTKFRVGDRVTLKTAEIIQIDQGATLPFRVRFPGGRGTWIMSAEIVTHKPRIIRVGDRVKRSGVSGIWLVLAVQGEWTWLCRHAEDPATAPASDLTLAITFPEPSNG